jgi:hypothetical protein
LQIEPNQGNLPKINRYKKGCPENRKNIARSVPICCSLLSPFVVVPPKYYRLLIKKFATMAGRFFFAAALVAVHSFTPALADENPSTITTAPKAKRTPYSHHDIAKRQAGSSIETTSPLPLTDYQYPYSAIPEQVNPFAVGRGPQAGYNRCNSTTEGPTSECQTMEVNSLVCLPFGF